MSADNVYQDFLDKKVRWCGKERRIDYILEDLQRKWDSLVMEGASDSPKHNFTKACDAIRSLAEKGPDRVQKLVVQSFPNALITLTHQLKSENNDYKDDIRELRAAFLQSMHAQGRSA